LVFHEGSQTVWDKQRKRGVVEVVGSKGTEFQRSLPSLRDLLSQRESLDPIDLRPKFQDGIAHRFAPVNREKRQQLAPEFAPFATDYWSTFRLRGAMTRVTSRCK